MITTKYFDGIRDARAKQRPVSELPPFDLGRSRSKGGFGDYVKGLFIEDPRWWLTPLRRWWPILRIGRFVLVTRNEDVRDVLERGDEFATPYGPDMTEMGGGANFILGMQDGADYRKMKSSVLSAFPPDEVERLVRPIAAKHSRDIMARAAPGFDAVGGLLKIVPTRICRDYFGMVFDDEVEFSDWSIALSALFFSDPFASQVTRELAVQAAERMIKSVDRSIEAVREGRTSPDTPLARMVALMDQDKVSLKDIHSIMLGMIAGFAPTNLLAGGNCLDVILSKQEARAAVEAAIEARDTKKLDKAVLEAMRFKPIWIGPWRHASRDAYIAKGTRRERLVRQGSTVMPATLSAMFDPAAVERPNDYLPGRPQRDYLVYGHGIHLCIGAEVARVQIGECLRALFEKKGLRRAAGKAGRMTRLGAFPETLCIDFERAPLCRVTPHALITVICPVKAGVSLASLKKKVEALGNPAVAAMRGALDAAGIVHFASLAVPETGKVDEATGQETGMLVLELSGDGATDEVIAAFAHHAEPILRPVFEEACALPPGAKLREFLARHNVDISPSFGSNAGLVFAGTPGHSIERIRAEAELAEIARRIVERPRPAGPGGAAAILAEVREHVEAGGKHPWAFQSAESLLERRSGSWWGAVMATLRAPAVMAGATLILLACWWITYALVFGYAPGFFRNLMVGATSLLLTLLGLLALVAALLGVSFLALRRLERSDPTNSTTIALDKLDAILEHEDRTAQNHLTAISVMKPGTLRRLALRLTFYLISISARHVFRPGFLATINSIHFARWVLLPGTDRLMFFSNYGGSWESYLEDFVAKASPGLTGVWSNTVGYPRTRWLFLDGARDGDRFKRWARRQQVPTLFWYSAYPELNTQRIRINSRIRRGICLATDSEARDWLSLFGSRPRPRLEGKADVAAGKPSLPAATEQLETGEIQSIFFSAFGALEFGQMIALAVPEGLPSHKRREWMEFLATQTSFGDPIPRVRAMTVGFGPDGLRRLGLDAGLNEDPLDRFPTAFRHGMGSPQRSRILDDVGDSRPEHWQWGSPDKPVDMVVLCYAANLRTLKAEIAKVKKKAAAAGIRSVAELPLQVRREGRRAIEHFGFADGVSQPVVRGTARAHAGVAPMQLVAAGEFLFGYRDEHGFYPVSPGVRASHDRGGLLPALRFRRGTDGTSTSLHDFGRNGSFLVVRQFEQHVEEFETYCAFAATKKSREHDDPAITPKWIAAKMMGRWQDGSSLVRNPEGRSGRPADNDFSFGAEDPQGHRCPFGAHVRRANPRDSLGDDHDVQIRIGKRHRILRVGRTYEQPAKRGGKPEKGLLFMCLNADIERQYEFMQQTWVSAPSFHGLVREKDPSIGSNEGDGRFSIPRWEGGIVLEDIPRFVTTRGGGYFFMPSLSALRFMISRL
ncbi:MAG: Dyp-type peroxidase [Mesorhizobium sp.]|nr:Dyp-type peroxidase [Mesorhizobium sp.]